MPTPIIKKSDDKNKKKPLLEVVPEQSENDVSNLSNEVVLDIFLEKSRNPTPCQTPIATPNITPRKKSTKKLAKKVKQVDQSELEKSILSFFKA